MLLKCASPRKETGTRYVCSFTLRIDVISFLCNLDIPTSLNIHHLVTRLHYTGNRCTTIYNTDLCYVVLWTIILTCSFTFADAPKKEEIRSPPSSYPTPQASTDDTLGRWCTQSTWCTVSMLTFVFAFLFGTNYR